MKLNLAIKALGVLDLCLIGWVVLRDVIAQRIPFVTAIYDAFEASQAFGLYPSLSLLISIVGNIALFSMFFSGYLMVKEKKVGVYISLLQAPLRVFLIIPPTFYFLGKSSQVLQLYPIFIVVSMYVLEAIKVLFQILWIREKRNQAEIKETREKVA